MDEGYFHKRADFHANRVGVDPELFRRLVATESNWNPNIVAKGSGATGLTQVISSTAADPGFGVKPITNRYDHEDSLRFGADYLSALGKKYKGDMDKALAAYNWGTGHVDQKAINADGSLNYGALPEETRKYIAKINGTQVRPDTKVVNSQQPAEVAPPKQMSPVDSGLANSEYSKEMDFIRGQREALANGYAMSMVEPQEELGMAKIAAAPVFNMPKVTMVAPPLKYGKGTSKRKAGNYNLVGVA